MNSPERIDVSQATAQNTWTWPGLGLWNLYFIIKLALLWAGYLNLGLYAGIPEISVSPAPVPPRAHPGR